MRAFWLAAALHLALAGPVLGQTAPLDEEVVVRPSDQATTQAFVREITAMPSSYGQAPSWHEPLCFNLVGVSETSQRSLLDRLSANARDLGVQVAAPGCRANVLIAFASDVNAVVADADRNSRRIMGVDTSHGISMGAAAWRDFVETPRPVRWWHVSRLVNRDDEQMQNRSGMVVNNSAGDSLGGATVRDSGYIHRPTHLNMRLVFIVVDVARVNGVPLNALADYLTMVSMAPIDPNADLEGAPTILNLFSATGAAEMTDWDRGYLRGLYATNPNASHSGQQEREVARRMRTGN